MQINGNVHSAEFYAAHFGTEKRDQLAPYKSIMKFETFMLFNFHEPVLKALKPVKSFQIIINIFETFA